MSALVPCPSCARHVRATESSCPFCATVLPDALTATPSTSKRLSRLAAFTFATAVAVTGAVSAGCSGSEDGTGESEGQLGGIMPMYGAPVPHQDAGSCDDQADDKNFDPGSIYAMYGAPVWDASASHDAGTGCTKDAGSDSSTDAATPWHAFDAGGFHAMYGAPPN